MSRPTLPQALGKYAVRGTLGRGAMGTVYDGWDPVIDRRVAIKTVGLPDAADADAVEALARFKREAQAAGRLNHANIVGVFDYGETAELAFIVMEFVEGRSLKEILAAGERLAPADTVRLMEDVLAGLAYSHEHGVVHRDIKPANIMITRGERAKIADFGIARIEASSMTQAGTVLGTPAYMSPEQFMGQVVDRRTDIYSCGVMLYQLLTGERPFDGSMSAIMHKALTTVPPRPSDLSVTVPAGFDAVVAKAMARRPEDRYPTAAAFAQALRENLVVADPLAGDATVMAPSRAGPAAAAPPPPPAAAKRASKAPLVAAGGAGLAAAAGVVLWLMLPGAPPPPKPDAGTWILTDPPKLDPAAQHASTTPETVKPAEPPAQHGIIVPDTIKPVEPPAQHASITPDTIKPAEPATKDTPKTVEPAHPEEHARTADPPKTADPLVKSAPGTLLFPGSALTGPPSQPPAGPSAAAIAASLPGVPCTLARAKAGLNGTVTVEGSAGAGAPEDAVRKIAAASTWRIRSFDGPYCPALDLLRPVAAGSGAAVDVSGPASLADNDIIPVQITMPDFAGALHVAYLQHDATVSPLVPGAGYPAQTYAAHARTAFGQPRADFQGWRVGPPFGTDMIVVVASTAPLFAKPLPDSQPLDAYLRALQAAISDLRRRGGSVAANALLLDTRPQP